MPVVPEGLGEATAGELAELPYRQLTYQVEVDGLRVGGFQRVSGLAMQMETVQYREGGRNESVHQLPGQISHSNLVLERGLTNRTVLWDWMQDVRSPAVSTKSTRRNLRVILQGGYRANRTWGWEFQGAYPVKWDGPDLSSQGAQNVVAVQSLEFAHDGFDKLAGTP